MHGLSLATKTHTNTGRNPPMLSWTGVLGADWFGPFPITTLKTAGLQTAKGLVFVLQRYATVVTLP